MEQGFISHILDFDFSKFISLSIIKGFKGIVIDRLFLALVVMCVNV